MNLGISIVKMKSEYAGHTQIVEMVRVRDLDNPEHYAVSSMVPEDARPNWTMQERFDSALIKALKKFRGEEES